MQAIAPTSARHHATGELIHNNHLTVLDDILVILVKKPVGLDKLLGGVQKFGCPHVTFFKGFKTLCFFILGNVLGLSDRVAFFVNIRKNEIPQTAAGK